MTDKEKISFAINQISINNCDGSANEDSIKAVRLLQEVHQALNIGDVSTSLTDSDKYEPYFGWCSVDNCENEGCSGGIAWRETGYWTVCSKHSEAHRNGHSQPKMKQSAINKEKRRDKKTGWLT